VLSEQLNKFVLQLEQHDATPHSRLPEVLEPIHHERGTSISHNGFSATKILSLRSDDDPSVTGFASPASSDFSPQWRTRRADTGNSSFETTPDISAALSKLPAAYFNSRFQGNQSAIRSIVVENIQLATSLQSQIEKLKECVKLLDAERLKVDDFTREVAGLNRLLEVSRESERFAVEETRACEQNCDVLIKSIKDKVAESWKVEEQKQIQMQAHINSLKLDVEELRQRIAQFERDAAENDEKQLRLQHRHEMETEHLKLLHEEECSSLKKQLELNVKQAALQLDEFSRNKQSSESALSARVQEDMAVHHARLREEQLRFSSQLQISMERLNDAREQRANMMESLAAKSQEIEELTNQLHMLKKEFQRKEVEVDCLRRERDALVDQNKTEIEFCRQNFERQADELRHSYTQKQLEDKQALDAGWVALQTLRKEVEESVFADSQIQLEAVLSRMRQNFLLEFQKYETQIATLEAQLAAAEQKLQKCEADRDAIKEQLHATPQQVKDSEGLQDKMREVEQSFLALTAKLEASARTESQLRDVIHEQEEAALITDTIVRQLESRNLQLSEINKKAEFSRQASLQEKVSLNENALNERMEQVQVIQSLKERLDACFKVESQLRNRVQEQQDSCAATALTVQNLEATVLLLKEQLKQKDEISSKEKQELQERISQEAAISKGARDLMARTVQQYADDQISLQQMRGVADELKICQQALEEEKKLRLAAQEEVASLTSNSQLEDFMRAAHNMVETEREHFEKERTADRVRLIEMQLEFKRCKDELRAEKESAVKARNEAMEHQQMLVQMRQQFGGMADERKKADQSPQSDKKQAEEAALKRPVGQATEDPELCSLLTKIGNCTNGLKWVREAGGYVCTGGGHRVTDDQVMR
jgi:hypothetical protein